jgi:hypothetical protein
MKFRTEIDVRKAAHYIGYEKPILMLGSCFTDNIGAKFKKYLFNISVNPFGVTFNPLSIQRGIKQLLSKEEYLPEDLLLFNDLYFSFNHYTKFSDPDKTVALSKINKEFFAAKKILHNAGTLILTFGSAFVYELKETGEVVNNCHKFPASKFNRRLLAVEEIVTCYSKMIEELQSLNPDLKILFTVSPVRHIKDGLIENQRSKSALLLSVRDLENQFSGTCSYFPAYEIMMDDLRDYRYYDADLLHPNDQAIDYIWGKFIESMLNKSTNDIINQLNPLLRAFSHRPIHPESTASIKFQTENEEKRKKLQESFPFLNWSEFK